MHVLFCCSHLQMLKETYSTTKSFSIRSIKRNQAVVPSHNHYKTLIKFKLHLTRYGQRKLIPSNFGIDNRSPVTVIHFSLFLLRSEMLIFHWQSTAALCILQFATWRRSTICTDLVWPPFQSYLEERLNLLRYEKSNLKRTYHCRLGVSEILFFHTFSQDAQGKERTSVLKNTVQTLVYEYISRCLFKVC